MLLTLVRHGQSEGNLHRVIRGWGGGSLTPLGRQEASLVGLRLASWGHFDALYSSPLVRAHETATIVGARLGLRPLLHDGLKELNVGALDGLGREQAEASFPGLIDRWRRDDPTLVLPEGEAVLDFFERAKGAFRSVCAPHPHGHILVVSHVCLLSAYLTQVLDRSPSIRLAWEMWNCSVTQLEFTGGGVRLRRFNDHSHLDHLFRG
ncbi:MAG: histidine phosphatase family protein [Dehalococcoidia bacterium]|nr:histidine phosphatase family protein [Dehalococcoidia bacterium]